MEAIQLERAEAASASAAAEGRNRALDAQAGQLEEASTHLAALERQLDEREQLMTASEAAVVTHNVREQVPPTHQSTHPPSR